MRRASLWTLVNPVTLLLVGVMLVNVAAFAVWTAPRWGSRLGVAGESASVGALRQRIEPRLEVTRETYGRLQRGEADLEAFRESLITTAGGAELLGMLAGAGERVGMRLDDASMQFGQIEELGVVQVTITFPIVATYFDMRQLVDELLALPIFLVIDGIGMQSSGRDASAPPDARAAAEGVRGDLVLSVFVEDPELALPEAPAARPDQSPAIGEQSAERLRAQARRGDPEDMAESLIDELAALPPLPVDPASLVVHLERLQPSHPPSEPTRNLFAVVLPPAPPVEIVDVPEIPPEPEPELPVRLLGVLRIDGRWHASLGTDDADLFVAEAGETLPNGVEVVEVGADYAEVLFGGDRIRLNLEGNSQ